MTNLSISSTRVFNLKPTIMYKPPKEVWLLNKEEVINLLNVTWLWQVSLSDQRIFYYYLVILTGVISNCLNCLTHKNQIHPFVFSHKHKENTLPIKFSFVCLFVRSFARLFVRSFVCFCFVLFCFVLFCFVFFIPLMLLY